MTDQDDMILISREAVREASHALRKAVVHQIAFADNTPYKDDPRWSPWTRWQKPLADRCRAARERLQEALQGE